VRNIPSFEETRRRTPARDASTQQADAAGNDQGKEGLLIDFDTPSQPAITGDGNIDNPFDTFNATSAIRDEMAATRERDEKERRERERQTILEKREARRKSMGMYITERNKHSSLLTSNA
jgi:kinetochore protein Spc7/SPC105